MSGNIASVHVALGEKPDEAAAKVPGAVPEPHQAEPRFLNRTAAGVFAVGAVGFVQLGAPPSGFYWSVRAITTFANDGFTAVSGVLAGLFITSAVGGDVPGANLSDLRYTNIATPSTVIVTKHGVVAFPGQELVMVWSGTVSGSAIQYGANVTVEEYPIPPTIRKNSALF